MSLRLCAVSYLNAAPLVWDFEHGRHSESVELIYAVPSKCAEMLRRGTADVGLIPVAAYPHIPGLQIIPGCAIASPGPVRSILLISKVPLEMVRTVAADNTSRTSVALCRVIFRSWYGGNRKFVSLEPNLPKMLRQADAALLIGDAALTAQPPQGTYVYDLAELWRKHTGKSFVFAFWAVRGEASAEARKIGLTEMLLRSRKNGTRPESIRSLAKEWRSRVYMSERQIVDYLTRNLDYKLSVKNLAGMKLFLRYAVEQAVLPEMPRLRFLSAPRRRAASR